MNEPMKILFELSKEHPLLPTNEVISSLNSLDISYKVLEKNDNIFLIDSNIKINKIKKLSDRLSYSYFIDELFFSCSNNLEELEKNSKEVLIDTTGSIAVRYVNRSKDARSQDIFNTIVNIIADKKKVDLRNPDIEIRVFITDDKTYVGRKIYEINRSDFEKRKVQFRPFFLPVSMHPKLARALVNLSEVEKNELLLDPFCGTGGIIIEAGLIGVRVIGSDVVEKMIIGCKKTLDHYKIKDYELFCLDIGEINKSVGLVDAIVTDLPYGKSTTTMGENMEILIERTFKVFNDVLKKNSKLVVGFSNKDFISIGAKWFKLVEIYEFFTHKSLTRYFVVYKN